jgi:hypothetical protein
MGTTELGLIFKLQSRNIVWMCVSTTFDPGCLSIDVCFFDKSHFTLLILKSIRKTRRTKKDIIKMDLREIEWSVMDWICLAQDRD